MAETPPIFLLKPLVLLGCYSVPYSILLLGGLRLNPKPRNFRPVLKTAFPQIRTIPCLRKLQATRVIYAMLAQGKNKVPLNNDLIEKLIENNIVISGREFNRALKDLKAQKFIETTKYDVYIDEDIFGKKLKAWEVERAKILKETLGRRSKTPEYIRFYESHYKTQDLLELIGKLKQKELDIMGVILENMGAGWDIGSGKFWGTNKEIQEVLGSNIDIKNIAKMVRRLVELGFMTYEGRNPKDVRKKCYKVDPRFATKGSTQDHNDNLSPLDLYSIHCRKRVRNVRSR